MVEVGFGVEVWHICIMTDTQHEFVTLLDFRKQIHAQKREKFILICNQAEVNKLRESIFVSKICFSIYCVFVAQHI